MTQSAQTRTSQSRLLFAGLSLLILLAPLCAAQTVRPLIDENVVKAPGKKASGRIEYYNDSLEPLVVTLEAKSFTVSATGDISYRSLDPDIHLNCRPGACCTPPFPVFASARPRVS
ncbi:MAG TPA: hypothetical protein VKT29_09135 [Terriglobales bacterium]|nr:hypothetical protein [Terriglobales bacterium]